MAPFTLNDLQPGQASIITALASEGPERRRLMDLGLIPGTRIEVERRSPLGDPTAYRVRGTLLALRREQAALIYVESTSPETDNS